MDRAIPTTPSSIAFQRDMEALWEPAERHLTAVAMTGAEAAGSPNSAILITASIITAVGLRGLNLLYVTGIMSSRSMLISLVSGTRSFRIEFPYYYPAFPSLSALTSPAVAPLASPPAPSWQSANPSRFFLFFFVVAVAKSFNFHHTNIAICRSILKVTNIAGKILYKISIYWVWYWKARRLAGKKCH